LSMATNILPDHHQTHYTYQGRELRHSGERIYATKYIYIIVVLVAP